MPAEVIARVHTITDAQDTLRLLAFGNRDNRILALDFSNDDSQADSDYISLLAETLSTDDNLNYDTESGKADEAPNSDLSGDDQDSNSQDSNPEPFIDDNPSYVSSSMHHDELSDDDVDLIPEIMANEEVQIDEGQDAGVQSDGGLDDDQSTMDHENDDPLGAAMDARYGPLAGP
ncbi:hypothetical protein ACA910_019131 [Epithemia clementina (nom. ined.)]